MDNINSITKKIVRESLFNSFKEYGIEGTEQKIKEVYKRQSKIVQALLEEYRKILNKEGGDKK